MNARQKAKRFKRLYEATIPRKSYYCNYRVYDKHHYRVSTSFTYDELKFMPSELISETAIDNLIPQLVPILRRYLQERKNTIMDFTLYSIDLWL